ncbi:MAG: hypothetical protein HKN48_05830 [Flavobacteriaceae bacterium]|nr:hypothetical protein [Flavobacteriaceae bacterium]
MIALSHKSKQYGLIALKVFLLTATFLYIYHKLTDSHSVSLSDFLNSLEGGNVLLIAVFILMAMMNWIFEILKWQSLAGTLTNISFRQAARQCLSAFTVSMITPMRVGEYGAKAIYFERKFQKRVLTLNLFSNLSQLLVTIVFGLPALIYLAVSLDLPFSNTKLGMGVIGIFIVAILMYIFRKKSLVFKGLSLNRIATFFMELPFSVKFKTILFSFLRYLVFSSLFLVLLNYFGIDISWFKALPLIYAMYLLVSLAPTILLLDVVIRGGVAVWLFSLIGVNEWPVLCVVLSMWLLNFVLPALWGSYYILTYRLPKS